MQRRAASGAGDCEASIADALLRLVRPRAAASPLARGARRDARSLHGLAQRDHAAADDGQGGAAPLRPLPQDAGPTSSALARADLGEVLAAWAGLGYYARARNLHACARDGGRRVMAADFPATEAGLRALPGIGDYTAAAIAAIAFGEPATPVDGNIERVVARLFAVTTPLPDAKAEIKALAKTSHAEAEAWRFRASDDGSRRHALHAAPPGLRAMPGGSRVSRLCAMVSPRRFPIARRRAERPVRRGVTFVALREDGAVLLRERPLRGLLGGMLETPSSPWAEEKGKQRRGNRACAAQSGMEEAARPRRAHLHPFPLELSVYRAEVGLDAEPKRAAHPARCRWLGSARACRTPRCPL